MRKNYIVWYDKCYYGQLRKKWCTKANIISLWAYEKLATIVTVVHRDLEVLISKVNIAHLWAYQNLATIVAHRDLEIMITKDNIIDRWAYQKLATKVVHRDLKVKCMGTQILLQHLFFTHWSPGSTLVDKLPLHHVYHSFDSLNHPESLTIMSIILSMPWITTFL